MPYLTALRLAEVEAHWLDERISNFGLDADRATASALVTGRVGNDSSATARRSVRRSCPAEDTACRGHTD
jgi:hypothetical protein